MVPGSIVLALAIGKRWAVPIMNAFVQAGGEIALHAPHSWSDH